MLLPKAFPGLTNTELTRKADNRSMMPWSLQEAVLSNYKCNSTMLSISISLIISSMSLLTELTSFLSPGLRVPHLRNLSAGLLKKERWKENWSLSKNSKSNWLRIISNRKSSRRRANKMNAGIIPVMKGWIQAIRGAKARLTTNLLTIMTRSQYPRRLRSECVPRNKVRYWNRHTSECEIIPRTHPTRAVRKNVRSFKSQS